ncbi:MAG TPA: hypothetical protein PLN24_05145, partial [Victivallales bacterium]|nr:hypothetical protein [Victivallales bacterium]
NINKYVLEWERKSTAVSPKILINSKQLDDLRKEYNNQSLEIMRELKNSAEKDIKELSEIDNKYKTIEEKLKNEELKLKTTKSKKEQSDLKKTIDKLKKDLKDIQKQKNNLEKNSSFASKIAMILSTNKPLPPVPENQMPDPGVFLDTRYQDDGCNPTNYGTRRLVNQRFPYADLYSAGSIIGGAKQAAIGYIFTDLDSWPGWHNGWQPGNPNFHTDKYIASIFAGALLFDHPHSKEWLEFGISNLQDDLRKVVTAPDGSGYECPGYSGYSIGLQLEIIRTIYNCGFKNIPLENPLIKKTAKWHRKLITPYDFRIRRRHEAPLGDTHRWDSGLGTGFRDLAIFYSEKDPEFASELVGTHKLLIDSGAKFKEKEFSEILSGSFSIASMPPEKMDWVSEKFEGFGAIFRNNYGKNNESFATFKAGQCRGHYHNDELTYHLYLNNSPISLDYNCSYHPRGDHAALHNSLTFGKEGKIKHNQTNNDIRALEQDFGIGKISYFKTSPYADIIVAEKSSDTLLMSPIFPEDAEFGRTYPSRKTSPMLHRRWFALIKHENKSKIGDYIVVYDETKAQEEKAINIHLLSRFTEQKGNIFKSSGQYDKDFIVFIASELSPKCEIRGWGYIDEFMASPGKEYELKPGETQQDYVKRMEKIGKSLPIGNWTPKWEKDEDWQKLAIETNYQSLIPPPNWKESWMYGEYQQWLRIIPDQNKATLWCLYAFDKGSQEPQITATENGNGIKIYLNELSEEVIINPVGKNGQFILKQNEKENILIPTGTIPSL